MGNKEYKSQSCDWKTSVKKNYWYIHPFVHTVWRGLNTYKICSGNYIKINIYLRNVINNNNNNNSNNIKIINKTKSDQ